MSPSNSPAPDAADPVVDGASESAADARDPGSVDANREDANREDASREEVSVVPVGEIQKADPTRRSLTVLVVLAVCGVGLWSVWDLRNQIDAAHQLTQVTVSGGARAMVQAADDFFRMLSGWCLVLALYLGFLGSQILRHGRFPVPGAKVIRDTRVVDGARARVRGALATVLALVFLFGSVVLPARGGEWVRELLAVALTTPDPDPTVIDPDAFDTDPAKTAPSAPDPSKTAPRPGG